MSKLQTDQLLEFLNSIRGRLETYEELENINQIIS